MDLKLTVEAVGHLLDRLRKEDADPIATYIQISYLADKIEEEAKQRQGHLNVLENITRLRGGLAEVVGLAPDSGRDSIGLAYAAVSGLNTALGFLGDYLDA